MDDDFDTGIVVDYGRYPGTQGIVSRTGKTRLPLKMTPRHEVVEEGGVGF